MADLDKQELSADSNPEQKQNQAAEQDSELSDEIIDIWTTEANKGSEKHQLLLGYHYLKLGELNIDAEVNIDKAMTWLIAASKQGNVEATEKLRHCVQTNFGVNEQNKAIVTWCLTTSASEKKIRYAAKSLFYKINTAQKGFLSKDEYKEAINKLTAGHEKERKLLLAAGNKIGKVISENDFVKILSKKIHGTMTLTSAEMDETNAAYDSAGLFQKVFLYPRQTVVIAFDRVLEYSSKEGMHLVMSLIPTNQLYLLTLMLVYSYLTPGFLLLAIPLMGFVISFLAMVISTLQMFYKRRKQKDAVTLATMLQQQFDMDIDLESTESQYSWNSLTPYFVFFTCLPIMIVSFSLTNKLYIPCAELFVISLVMTGLCFLGLSDSHDVLTLMALGSHAFASLPIFFAHLPQVPIITKLIELVTQPFFSVYLGLNVSFNISLPSISYLLIPVLFLCMAIKGSWSGVHKILIPHLVCYFWFSFSTVAFPFTSWTGLARATVGYMLLPVFVPLSVFFMIIGIPYTVYKLLQTELIGKMIVTAVLLAIPIVLYQTKAFFGKKGEKTSQKDLKIRKIVMISFAVLSILPLLFVRVPTILERKTLTLTWEDYKDLCIPSKDDIWAPYQIRCRDFLETEVRWTGEVVQIKVTKVENTAENVIKALPSILSEPLYCIYGEKMPDCSEETMSDSVYKHCQLLKSAGQTCSLHSHNQVFFSLSIQIEEYIVNIDAGPNFESGLLVLEPGDDLEFSGTLTSVGTPSPSLKLKSINCTSRELNVEMKVEDFTGNTLLKLLNDAVALLFNFFLFPVLEYSAE